jgi:MHS family proline/betaine transporter-like MFS transporter
VGQGKGAWTPAKRNRSAVIYSSIGAIVEWYDFMLFAFLAPVFARVFFPTSDEIVSLLATFGVYAAGFLMGPLGSLVFGSLGDRLGRKFTLTLSVGLMAIPMLITAALPTYATIGLAAPLLLLLMRLIQGFSVGGQYGGTMVLLVEDAPPDRRGFIASAATATSGVGVFLASGMVTLITALTTTAELDGGVWRIPYVFGFLLALTALIMRRRMAESQAFAHAQESGELSKTPLRSIFKEAPGPLLMCILLSAYANVTYYLLTSYLPAYLENVIDVDHFKASLATTIIAALFAITAPLFGRLSDQWGRKPLLLAATAGFLVLSVPAFLVLGGPSLTFFAILGAELVLLIPLGLLWGSYGAAAPELFPTKFRYTGTAIGYNLGNSVCGGSVAFIATGLIAATGSTLAPAWILVAFAALSLVPMLRMRETLRVAIAT